MSDAEDDYLSDKFLSQAPALPTSKPLTYVERRRQAQREAEAKNVQNRKKSRRELEEESRREGLSKSLFERARDEGETGAGQGSKAMAMMMKMGFKPGQSLGKTDEPNPKPEANVDSAPDTPPQATRFTKTSGHLVEPLPLDVWSGRLGVGKRKRAVSPTVAGKLAKVLNQTDEAHGSFRERARQDYEERRAEGRLTSATRTCITLDEKAEKSFNVLWLNPQDPESFPPDLLEALTADFGTVEDVNPATNPAEHERLRRQMQTDALQPLPELEEDGVASPPRGQSHIERRDHFAPEVVETARAFIRMSAQARLDRLLAYLRDEYFYCFWCGTQYTDLADLAAGCPGPEEEVHD